MVRIRGLRSRALLRRGRLPEPLIHQRVQYDGHKPATSACGYPVAWTVTRGGSLVTIQRFSSGSHSRLVCGRSVVAMTVFVAPIATSSAKTVPGTGVPVTESTAETVIWTGRPKGTGHGLMVAFSVARD